MRLLTFFLQYFQKEMPAKFEADPETVMALAFSLKINQKKMKKMEKEYMTMKTQEKEDEIELRVRINAVVLDWVVEWSECPTRTQSQFEYN